MLKFVEDENGHIIRAVQVIDDEDGEVDNGMTIDELITFCEEEEHNHRLNCKRYDDASGYTRSKDKNIRTACAIREDTYADFYKEISATMRKYQKIEEVMRLHKEGKILYPRDVVGLIRKVIEDGEID